MYLVGAWNVCTRVPAIKYEAAGQRVGAISMVDATMQSSSPNGRQVHPHNGPVFLPSSFLGRIAGQEPWLNKTFVFPAVAKSRPLSASSLLWREVWPDSTWSRRKAHLSSLLTVTRAKSSSREPDLSQVTQSYSDKPRFTCLGKK